VKRSGRVTTRCRGRRLEQRIAAIAANVGAIVLTHDDHFNKIHRVSCRILPKEAP
jgi:predicted nucleic acid-binding protein